MKLWIIGVFIALFALILWPLTLWTDRNLEFYLSLAKGQAVDVPNWISFLVTLVLNGVVLALNIVGELVRLVVG